MKIFNKLLNLNKLKIKTVSDLNDEQKAHIQDRIEDGYKPMEISDELNIPVKVVYYYKNDLNRRSTTKAAQNNSEIQKWKDQIEIERLKIDLDTIKEQRRISLEKSKAEIKQIEAETEIMKLEAGMEQDDPSEQLIPFLQNLLIKSDAPKTPAGMETIPNAIPTPAGIHLTDEQISEEIKNFSPALLRKAKKMPADELKMVLINHQPELSKQTLNRAIEMIQNGN